MQVLRCGAERWHRRPSRVGAVISDTSASATILRGLKAKLDDLEEFYKDLHSHPELSMQETRTAGLVAERLRASGFEVTEGVGGTGVVGLLKNGDGPAVMLRADMDALPVEEQTGLAYASTVTGTDADGNTTKVMHACGHDFHVAWLAGASALMADAKDAWNGTLMVVFQPAEETAEGAQAMIDDGLFERFPKPDVILGQHVMSIPAGQIASRAGVVTSAGDSLEIRMFGRGAHGSMPQASIDPVVMAASTVLRLQTIVSRELAPTEAAVVTIGALQAGTKENVIPDDAVIKLNVRTFDEAVRTRVLGAIERIVNAESAAAGAPRPPEITPLDRYDLVRNDEHATERIRQVFSEHFGDQRVSHTGPTSASEDFGSFGVEWHAPSVFWFVGGVEAEIWSKAESEGKLNELPTNHNPKFAPAIHPTLATGVETLVVASCAWLAESAGRQ